MKVFDWHIPYWNRLLADRQRLPHALLLAGPAGIGKRVFAHALSGALLCEARPLDGVACGTCSSCGWLVGGNHPDFRLVSDDCGDAAETEDLADSPPARQRRSIGIDQIRALEDFAFVGSHRQGSRVVLLADAEAMTIAAANALLKMLEEPPSGLYFILVSSQPRRLLPTVLSRCQRLDLAIPDRAAAQRWLDQQGVGNAGELLNLAAGAPLIAADWSAQGIWDAHQQAVAVLADKPRDPVAMAAQWAQLVKGSKGLPLSALVIIVQKWLLDLALIKLADTCRYHLAWRGKLESLAAGAPTAGLLACYNDLLRIKAVVTHPLNTQLVLEDMAARYLKALAGRA